MIDGIAPVDIAVIGDDPLWVVDRMNTLVRRAGGAYVREFATVLDALDDLTPDHPAVALLAPLSPTGDPDALAAIAVLLTERPELAFVCTTDDPNSALAQELEAIVGTQPLLADDTEAIVSSVIDALQDQRQAAGALAFGDGSDLAAAQAAEDLLVSGPDQLLQIVVVTSGKGGTGTTTVAINLAAALVETGLRVTMVDAHGATGDVGFLLGLETPERMALELVVLDRESVRRHTSVHRATAVRAVVLPIDENDLTTLTPRQLLEVLVALDDQADVVVVDIPIELVASSDITTFAAKVLIVTTSQLASLKNARIAADVIGRSAKLGLVRNDALPATVEHGREAIESSLQVELLAELPFDETIAEGSVADPVRAVSHPKSKYTKTMRRLADDLAKHAVARRP